MKRLLPILLCLLLLTACAAPKAETGPVLAATTRPVAQFTEALTQGTGLTVRSVITEPVSCLHDYSLSVEQMKLLSSADAVILSGCGLEDFMGSALDAARSVIDSSEGIATLPGEEGADPHIWLDPARAETMAENIANTLCKLYPEHEAAIRANLETLCGQLDELQVYGEEKLAGLTCREIVTFHDGFAYFAEANDLTVLAAMEEEAGSEPAASQLAEITELVRTHGLPCVFAEVNGSDRAAQTVAREAGVSVFTLDTAMGGDYFEAMHHNFDTIGEAMG